MSNLPDADRSAVLWYGAERRADKPGANPAENSAGTQLQPADTAGAEQEISIELWLFGLLSALTDERPVKLSLPATATTLDVLTALEARYGDEMLSRIRDTERGILPSCRVFVDGDPLEDAFTPISDNGGSPKVEMILVKGFEGG